MKVEKKLLGIAMTVIFMSCNGSANTESITESVSETISESVEGTNPTDEKHTKEFIIKRITQIYNELNKEAIKSRNGASSEWADVREKYYSSEYKEARKKEKQVLDAVDEERRKRRSEEDASFSQIDIEEWCNADIDLWTMSQDDNTVEFKIKKVKDISEKFAYVELSLYNGLETVKMRLLFENGNWFVDDFYYNEDNEEYSSVRTCMEATISGKTKFDLD